MLLHKKMQNIKMNYTNLLHHIDLNVNNIKYLCLIDLHPEMKNMATSIFPEQFICEDDYINLIFA